MSADHHTAAYPQIVNVLRFLWILRVLWSELGAFRWSLIGCTWPDKYLRTRTNGTPQPTHVLVVADPQILDSRSYPGRPPWLVTLSRLVVDMNMRKSWWAASKLKPDVVVFLGDMMDGGRYAMDDVEYEEYYQRFRSIFRTGPRVPVYYIPGNHDVGLGMSNQFSVHAQDRYISHFGEINRHVDIANHTFVLLDAPALVEEELQRARIGASFIHWAEVKPKGVIAYVQSLAENCSEKPTVLLTHIPLARPDDASCGPFREHGTIHRGTGFGYVNTLNEPVSDFLLQSLRPKLILSGDDHDYCEYEHVLPLRTEPERYPPEDICGRTPHTTREVTVKSFSMAMGVRRPGFQLLSLTSPSASPSESDRTIADVSCTLPDQIKLYLWGYVPLLVITLIVLLASNTHRVRNRRRHPSVSSSPQGHSGDVEWLSAPGAPHERFASRREGAGAKLEEDDDDALPPAVTTPRHHSRWSFVFQNRRRWVSCDCVLSSVRGGPKTRRNRGLVAGFLADVLDVAWVPLGLFAGIAWWIS